MRSAAVLSCTLLALVLAAVPPGSAQGPSGPTIDLASAPGTVVESGDVTVTASYQLTNAAHPGSLLLISAARVGGVDLQQHAADWTLGTVTRSTNRNEAADNVPSPGASSSLTITWRLGPIARGTTVSLHATVGRGSDCGGCGQVGDQAIFSVNVVAPAGGGGGGGSTAGPAGLGAVSGLRSDAVAADSIMLLWNGASGASSYLVYRSRTSGFEPGAATIAGSTTGTAFTVTGLTPGTLYHFRVRPVGDGGEEGAVSQQISVRTAAGSDREPPAAVTGLVAVKATAGAVSLAWQAATDDVGPVSYQVHRGTGAFPLDVNSHIATASGLTYTDTAVQADTAYTYRVRAIDGGGNVGAASDPVTVRTLAAQQDDLRAPAVLGVAFTGSSAGWILSWSLDEPAAVQVRLDGPGAPRAWAEARDVSFSVALGTLDIGDYAYTITATDDFGHAGTRSGTFRVGAGFGRFTALPADQSQAIEAALGVAAPDLFLLDGDLDGRSDGFVDASGAIGQRRALPQEGQFLIEAGGRLALATTAGGVFPVASVPGLAEGEDESDAVKAVTVRVEDKDGWILVTVADGGAGLPLLGVERGDGTPLPEEAAWREGRDVLFLDDPEATYRILYDNAGASAASGSGSGAGGLSGWLPYVAGAAGILLGMLVMAVLLRRRPA